MACLYAAMAVLCAVETFRYMENDSRFLAMGLEYLAYAGILAFLFRTRREAGGEVGEAIADRAPAPRSGGASRSR